MAKATMQTNTDRIRKGSMENALFEARPPHRPTMKLRGKQRKKALAEAGRIRRHRLDDYADYMWGKPDFSDWGTLEDNSIS